MPTPVPEAAAEAEAEPVVPTTTPAVDKGLCFSRRIRRLLKLKVHVVICVVHLIFYFIHFWFGCRHEFWICLLLTFLAYIPGIMYAVYAISN